MWQRTYQRKRIMIGWNENQANRAFIAKFAHLISVEEHRMYFDEVELDIEGC